MNTKALRLYGKNDIRLEEFELPPMGEDEILAHVISDSICMSTYKAAIQGPNHKRVPDDCAEHPVMVGHEFCGEIVKVGAKWADQFKEGQKFVIQTALNYKGSLDAPGYSYPYVGGSATYVILPHEVMECNCLLPFNGDAFYFGSLSEPLSCVIGAFHANYHTILGNYNHIMNTKKGGKMAILAGAGPMGLAAIDYAIHVEYRPSLLVVTDIDDMRLKRAASLITEEEAAKYGVKLLYVNTAALEDPEKELRELSGGEGYDDVFALAPVSAVVEQGDHILGRDGCLNVFAGATNKAFSAVINCYNLHYGSTHMLGTSGGNTDDMRESLTMMADGMLNPSILITHIGGLDSATQAILNLPKIPGGKKLIYTNLSMPLTAIDDFEELGKTDPVFKKLHEICAANNGIWCPEAEKYLLEHAKMI